MAMKKHKISAEDKNRLLLKELKRLIEDTSPQSEPNCTFRGFLLANFEDSYLIQEYKTICGMVSLRHLTKDVK